MTAAGDSATLFLALLSLSASGCAFAWGSDGFGQQGNGNANLGMPNLSPQWFSATADWSTLSAGGWYSCGIRDAGTLWCWGYNGYGQVGDGTTINRESPVQVGAESDWSAVSAGTYHTCGLRGSPGTLWCWGYNDYGQVGDGTTDDRSSPVQVGAATNWSAVSAGGYHTCGIRAGKLWCWGYNWYGQLGDGTTTNRSSPVQVGGSTDWSAVSAGRYHTCGLRGSPGTLWCWGRNASGQVGDGTTTNRWSPVPIGSPNDWIVVSAGGEHTCGVRAIPGTVWCWGHNGYGQVGDGTTDDRSSPVQIGVETDWSTVSAGVDHTCGIRSGTMWCWGRNFAGQVGDGTETDRSSPVQVGTSTWWTVVSAGRDHTLGIQGLLTRRAAPVPSCRS